MTDIAAPDAIQRAVQAALASTALPADHRRVVAIHVDPVTLDASVVFASKLGEHWQTQVMGAHDRGGLSAGVNIVGSWPG